jgi:hypothetical protein
MKYYKPEDVKVTIGDQEIQSFVDGIPVTVPRSKSDFYRPLSVKAEIKISYEDRRLLLPLLVAGLYSVHYDEMMSWAEDY